MSDPSTLAFGLTYTGALAVALLMFIGQLAAFGVFLILVGTAQLMVYALRAAEQAFTKPDRP